jgi:hypothetical protein
MKQKKQRLLKTLYERFAHHKKDDLETYKKEIKEKLAEYYLILGKKQKKSDVFLSLDVFEALKELNIIVSGTFYVSNTKDGKYVEDTYVFSDIWEKIETKKWLKDNNDRFLKVQVLASDFKDGVLVIYQNTRITDNFFNMHILRDKYSDFLLEGNIAHLV